jgi:hypothetical protein
VQLSHCTGAGTWHSQRLCNWLVGHNVTACRLHAQGQRWVPITDCGIPHAPDDPAFTSGLAQGVFIKDVTGQPYLGQVSGSN